MRLGDRLRSFSRKRSGLGRQLGAVSVSPDFTSAWKAVVDYVNKGGKAGGVTLPVEGSWNLPSGHVLQITHNYYYDDPLIAAFRRPDGITLYGFGTGSGISDMSIAINWTLSVLGSPNITSESRVTELQAQVTTLTNLYEKCAPEHSAMKDVISRLAVKLGLTMPATITATSIAPIYNVILGELDKTLMLPRCQSDLALIYNAGRQALINVFGSAPYPAKEVASSLNTLSCPPSVQEGNVQISQAEFTRLQAIEASAKTSIAKLKGWASICLPTA